MKRMAFKWLGLMMMVAASGCSSMAGKSAELPASKTLVAAGYSRFDDSGHISVNQRWLSAQQAAKLDAYRGLADQLYAEVLAPNKTVGSQVVGNEGHRVYLDTYLRQAQAADYRTVKDTLKATLQLTLTPRFYRCINGDAAVVNQCLQEDGKLALTRLGYKSASVVSANLACAARDCSDQLSVQGFAKDRHPVDDVLLDVGLYDVEWIGHTGINLLLIKGIVGGL